MFMMDCIRRMKGVDEMIVDSVFNSGDSLGVTESTLLLFVVLILSQLANHLMASSQTSRSIKSMGVKKNGIQFVIFSDVFL